MALFARTCDRIDLCVEDSGNGFYSRSSKRTAGFVFAVWDVFTDYEEKSLPLPGILASKILDYCVARQDELKAKGLDDAQFFWPPNFPRHRDNLRQRERLAEENQGSVPDEVAGDLPTPEEDLARIVYACSVHVEIRLLLPHSILELLDAEGRRILFPPDPDTLQRSLSSVNEFIRLHEQEKKAAPKWIIQVKAELEKKAATAHWILPVSHGVSNRCKTHQSRTHDTGKIRADSAPPPKKESVRE